jgi:hypothetical protein
VVFVDVFAPGSGEVSSDTQGSSSHPTSEAMKKLPYIESAVLKHKTVPFASNNWRWIIDSMKRVFARF